MELPDFDSLPKVADMPQGCAWGVFDNKEDGSKDKLGTLNLLTPEVVRGACAEARDGVSISLNWPLNGMPFALPGRIAPEHTHATLREAGLSAGAGWDDEVRFNTQASSQWDSLVHWAHQPSGLSYNGARATGDALRRPRTTADNALPTLDHWHGAGGLVARGVLLDWKAWAESASASASASTEEEETTSAHPLDGHRITVAELEAVAAAQGVELRPGDVLLVRTGLTETLAAPTPGDLAKLRRQRVAGVHGALETARWLWNRHFAAVAADNFAFEALLPLREDGSVGDHHELYLHPWLLAMFGMPIGELWDLAALSAHCKKTGRYSFMLTSVPLNLPGLVGSPPNALAIF
ncbi:putative cyclase-domain-containing protein [Xylariomycetidae sp. FL0641]|nr:putative cyclase-domain-containing protein [Xylariomycetidae sp. FL0641]